MHDFSPQGTHAKDKPKLLIVDDQFANIQLLHQALAEDFHVFMATSGKKALEICLLRLPDLVLLDVIMPDMDGYEVCKRLKANPLTADIPVIFVTAHNDEATETYALDLGAVDFISKPINVRVVRARVKTHVTLKRQSDLLRKMAFVDGLTGAHNRRYFDEQLANEVTRASQHGQTLSLIMMDIDYFKMFNDTYGHQAGDQCLKSLSAIFQACVNRPADTLARYGGEEFACLLPNTSLHSALTVAETIRMAVLKAQIPHRASAVSQWVTLSLGVSAMNSPTHVTATELLRNADHHLYEAKKCGRNRTASSAGFDSANDSRSHEILT
ncbi:MAG: diguanylate cyclase [Rhodoferax sp.]|nr:diguanylate cyclase [Rhodoferax sp.]